MKNNRGCHGIGLLINSRLMPIKIISSMNLIAIISFSIQTSTQNKINKQLSLQKSFNEHGDEKFLSKFDLSQVTGKGAHREEL